jgi:hypothetical protein
MSKIRIRGKALVSWVVVLMATCIPTINALAEPAQLTIAPPVRPADPLGMAGRATIVSIDQLPEPMQSQAKQHLSEMKQKGYYAAPDGPLDNYTISSIASHLRPMDEVKGKLAFPAAKLEGSPFDQFTFHGVVPDGGGMDKEVTGISRIFSAPNGAIIRLYEFDYTTPDRGVQMVQEFLNESVNGHPASLTVQKTSRGNAITILVWITNNKYYHLEMTGHVRGKGLTNKLVELASSFPE